MSTRQRQQRVHEAAQEYLGRRERVLAAGRFTRAHEGVLPARHLLLAVTDRHLVVLGVRDGAANTPRVRREITRWPLGETHVMTEPAPDCPVLVIAPRDGEPVAVRGSEGDVVAGALMALGVTAQ